MRFRVRRLRPGFKLGARRAGDLTSDRWARAEMAEKPGKRDRGQALGRRSSSETMAERPGAPEGRAYDPARATRRASRQESILDTLQRGPLRRVRSLAKKSR